MAARHTADDEFTIEFSDETMEEPSIAAAAFRKYRSTLLVAITEPEILPLANALYSKKVINRYDLEEAAMTTHTPTERKTRLLDAIEATIRVRPMKFWVLLGVLESDFLSLRDHADELSKLCTCIFYETVETLQRNSLSVAKLKAGLQEMADKAEDADSADEAQASVEESTESDDKENRGGLFSGLRKGIRKLFGAARDMTSSFVKGVLKSLKLDIKVSRKYKKRFDKHTNREQIHWWFEIWGDESALKDLESNWEKVSAKTKWRLEACPIVSQQC